MYEGFIKSPLIIPFPSFYFTCVVTKPERLDLHKLTWVHFPVFSPWISSPVQSPIYLPRPSQTSLPLISSCSSPAVHTAIKICNLSKIPLRSEHHWLQNLFWHPVGSLCDKIQTTTSGTHGPPKATPTHFYSLLPLVHPGGSDQTLHCMPQMDRSLLLWAFYWLPLPCALQLFPKLVQPDFLSAFWNLTFMLPPPESLPWYLKPQSECSFLWAQEELCIFTGDLTEHSLLVMEVSELPKKLKLTEHRYNVDCLNIPQQQAFSKHLCNML